MQALAAAQAQMQLQRQMLAQQQALLAAVPAVAPAQAALVAAAAAGGATLATAPAVDSATARKSREVYAGNLSIGSVTSEMLAELFNAALAGMVPDPIREPPVVGVKMDVSGRGPLSAVKYEWCAPEVPAACAALSALAGTPAIREQVLLTGSLGCACLCNSVMMMCG